MNALAPGQSLGVAVQCALCQSPIAPDEETTSCPGCRTPYHRSCWDEVGGCGIYGCPQVPPTEKRGDLEIPAGHWGQTTKACPSCGKDIQAMAIRCRHCAADLGRADPQTRAGWQAARATAGTLPGLRKQVVATVIGCALPPTAPIAVAFGIFLWIRRQSGLTALPRIYRALLMIALIAGAIQIVIFTSILAFVG